MPVKWIYAFLLCLACVGAYGPGRMENSSGDTISTRYWPVAILEHHTLKLNPLKEKLGGIAYAAINMGDDLLPRNGWGTAVFSVPFYAMADLLDLGGSDWMPDRINRVSRWNAILIATASVIALFFLLVRIVSPEIAMLSSAVFAFGTWNWSLAPQGLHSQTCAVLAHILSLHLLLSICSAPKGESPRLKAFFLGLIQALIWSLRPQDVLLIAPCALTLHRRRVLLPYAVAVLALILPLLATYKSMYGYYLGAYGVIDAMAGVATWQPNFLRGFFGMLFSPNRGAIVFFPLLLWVPYLWKKLIPSSKIPKSFSDSIAMGSMLYFGVLCFLVYWHSTWSYGPRYLYDLLPYIWIPLTLMFKDALEWASARKPRLPAPVIILCLICALEGVIVHGLGNYNYDLYVWNHRMSPVGDEAAWDFRNWMMLDVWKADSEISTRYPKGLERLKQYGF